MAPETPRNDHDPASIFCHEARTPLTVIRGCVDTLRSGALKDGRFFVSLPDRTAPRPSPAP